MSSGESAPRRGRTAIWVVVVVGALGLLLSTVATAVLGSEGVRYLLSVTGSDVLDVSAGAATGEVEPGRTYGLLVPTGSPVACRVWEPDGTPVALRDGATYTIDTPQGRWSGQESFTAPPAGAVLLTCEAAAPGDTVRLVVAPDWSLGPAILLVVLVALGSVMFLGAAVALVVILLRRHGSRPPRTGPPAYQPS